MNQERLKSFLPAVNRCISCRYMHSFPQDIPIEVALLINLTQFIDIDFFLRHPVQVVRDAEHVGGLESAAPDDDDVDI